jgi:mannose-6-phosphate isomerase-like protein (cupin superfamily)
MHRAGWQTTLALGCAVAAGCAPQHHTMTPQANTDRTVDNGAGVPGACTTPRASANDLGCFLIAEDALGPAPTSPVYWYLHTYPTRTAAQGAKTMHATIVESFGKVWLMTLADSNWRSPSGDFVSRVGPIPLTPGKMYTARYMDATFQQGMHTRVHRHSGPEAWFVLSGAQCLETPEGITVVRAGEGSVVREGPPMMLSGVGDEIRKALVLVVYDSSQPFSTAVHDWNAKGLCPT